MNINDIIYHKKNTKKYNNDLSPKTHISLLSEENEKDDKEYIEQKYFKNTLRKLDTIEVGLRKLISMGKFSKKYSHYKNTNSSKNKNRENSNPLKCRSFTRLTPFQIYEKNKKLVEILLRKKGEKKFFLDSFDIKRFDGNHRMFILKSLNSKNFENKKVKKLLINPLLINEFTSINNNNNNSNSKVCYSYNEKKDNVYTPNKKYNTINYNLKGNFITSIVPKGKLYGNSNRTFNNNLEIRHLYDISNRKINNGSKCNKIWTNNGCLFDFLNENEKIFPFFKGNPKTNIKISLHKKIFNNNYFNEFK